MNTFSWFVETSFSTRLSLALLHFLWQGCGGGLLVLVAGKRISSGAARLRYSINVAVLLLMAFCLPVTFCAIDLSDRAMNAPVAAATVPDVAHANPVLDEFSASPAVSFGTTSFIQEELRELPEESADKSAPSGTMTEIVQASHSASISDVYQALSRWIAALYFSGVTLVLGRLVRGVSGGHRLRRLACIIDDESLVQTVTDLARRLNLNVVPAIAWCEQISVPVVVGVLQPMILLPLAVVSGLTPPQLQALLLHELAHIRRFDPLVNLMQRMIEAVLFFHPAVWFVSRRVSIEREHAADDMVLSAGWDRPRYADALVRVAELSAAISCRGAIRHATVVGIAGTSPTEFKQRVLRLLDDTQPPKQMIGDMRRCGTQKQILLDKFFESRDA